MLVVGCSSSHTDRIKRELGDDFNNKVYTALGGEKDSLQRYKNYCEALKTKKVNPVEIKMNLLKYDFTNTQLQLANAEIDLANKDCGK